MPFTLKPLLFSYDSLEPYMDANTLEIHHDKHHQAYLDKFNAVVDKYDEIKTMTPEDILTKLNDLEVSDEDRTVLKNHGGGYVNHNIYWDSIGPDKQINDQLTADINSEFGSIENLKQELSNLAKSHFGSGWAWLVRDKNNNLKIYSLPNQDSPYTIGHTPILCIDVWEHAYYLKYQNKRADYVDNWWNVCKFL